MNNYHAKKIEKIAEDIYIVNATMSGVYIARQQPMDVCAVELLNGRLGEFIKELRDIAIDLDTDNINKCEKCIQLTKDKLVCARCRTPREKNKKVK